MKREGASAHLLRDGRLRLIHGPIDLIVTAEGPEEAVRAAYHRARAAFLPVLDDLVCELPRLRLAEGAAPEGLVARRMQAAIAPFAPVFITPMAAVAGAVADHVLAAILSPGHGLARAHVNNGGDIALWTSGTKLRLAICEDPVSGAAGAEADIGPEDGIGGVATSGWRGRSHSLGIADAVTVLAENAARADAAATLIANAVDLPGHPGITRAPAESLSPDSDLGARKVTVDVAPLPEQDIRAALAPGLALAEDYIARGLIISACLACQGQRRMTGAKLSALPHKELLHA